MPAAVRETRNPQSTSAHQSRAVVQLYLVTPLRLPETTVRIGGDADCEGGGNSFAEMRQTFPKRCWLLWTGVRNASVFAVAASSSIKRIFKPSTPSIDSSATGHIFLCLRPGSPQSLPKIFPAYPAGTPQADRSPGARSRARRRAPGSFPPARGNLSRGGRARHPCGDLALTCPAKLAAAAGPPASLGAR
jgi:hypothetical protein